MDWEQKTAIKRSEHTFFQNLYRIKQELPGAKASTAINTEVAALSLNICFCLNTGTS